MKKTVLNYSFIIVAFLLLLSCKDNFMLPASSGRPYEVLVVIDDQLWEQPAGRALFNVLDTDMPGLPQSERSFRISQTDPARFNQVLNIFRNIIVVDINKKVYSQTKMKFVRNRHAKPQVILTIQSPSKEEFAKYVSTNKELIIDFLVKVEMNRLVKELEKKHSKVVLDLSLELLNCQMWAPDEIKSYKKGKDFFWASSNSATAMVNICMYSYPYEGPQTFNKQYVLAKRDSVMKVNLPGAQPHMYMATDTLCTVAKPITVKNQYAYETRGLWHMQNDGMGGPFVSHSRVDTINNRVVVVEGFVFAPEKMKRGLVRRLEGALYTLNLPAEKPEELKLNIPEAEQGKDKK